MKYSKYLSNNSSNQQKINIYLPIKEQLEWFDQYFAAIFFEKGSNIANNKKIVELYKTSVVDAANF